MSLIISLVLWIIFIVIEYRYSGIHKTTWIDVVSMLCFIFGCLFFTYWSVIHLGVVK